MKDKVLRNELRGCSLQELETRLDSWRRELFGLRLNTATAHVKNHSQFKKLRRNIARVLTYLQQKTAGNHQ